MEWTDEHISHVHCFDDLDYCHVSACCFLLSRERSQVEESANFYHSSDKKFKWIGQPCQLGDERDQEEAAREISGDKIVGEQICSVDTKAARRLIKN